METKHFWFRTIRKRKLNQEEKKNATKSEYQIDADFF